MVVSTTQPASVSDVPRFTPQELPALRALTQRFPTVDAAVNGIAHLEALLQLPKGTVHIVSDAHGEHLMERHPEYHMQHRALIKDIDLERGTVRLNGVEYPLTDTALPTLSTCSGICGWGHCHRCSVRIKWPPWRCISLPIRRRTRRRKTRTSRSFTLRSSARKCWPSLGLIRRPG